MFPFGVCGLLSRRKSSGVCGFRNRGDRLSDLQTRAGFNSGESEYGRRVNLLL